MDTNKMREAFERTNSRDHRRQPPKGNNYIDPMAQADWESFQKGWQASREAVVVELGAPSHWVADYSACGGGLVVFDAEMAVRVTDPMCSKTPAYTINALEKAGLKVAP
ncbi:hypothetical protein [Pseudomonas sp. NBRC 111128]|uniref:hypothetical protein n=1 Tax=Pseudomonas sp. NBRC 111128 TaxID=1661043 RepID=UPI0006D46A85|nr:hypothetical protein [Pseudomonas sp. NBRC 111128]